MECVAPIIQSLGTVFWPIVMFSFLLIARKGINEFINNISEVILKAQTIKLTGGLTLSRNEVETALFDREMLKIGILVGASEFPETEELKELSALAKGMLLHVDTLSSKEKDRLFYHALELASADRVFSNRELKVFYYIGKHYGILSSKVKSDIRKYAEEQNITVEDAEL